MNNYSPLFGETFYDDTFHCGIPHEDILHSIKCPTVFMKKKKSFSPDGILLAALSEEDLQKVRTMISDCTVIRFNSSHGAM